MGKITIEDFYTEKPRWCAGCGNHMILAALKKFLVDQEIMSHQVANISGIGCSGRTTQYINTYGMHAIHGRPIPVGFGLALAREDLSIFIHSGDGDALSIGGNHLIHGINKNFNGVFLLHDNRTFALTKNQTSPTTPQGRKTSTHPFGVDHAPLNAMSLVLGAGASFVAATADWLADHMYHTIKAAYEHKGFSFVHVLQRCVHYNPHDFDSQSTDAFSFLIHKDGIPADKRICDKTKKFKHDPADLQKAFKLATSGKRHFGLFYRDPDKPCYEKDVLRARIKNAEQKPRSGILDQFKI